MVKSRTKRPAGRAKAGGAPPRGRAKQAAAKPRAKAKAKAKPPARPKPKAKPPARPKAKAKPPARPKAKPKPPARPAPKAKPPATTKPAARFTFEALPTLTSAGELTPLVRRQLVVDTRLGVGRTTTPDRIPAGYLDIGVRRWRVLDAGAPAYELVQNTMFFADSDEPLGIERIQGSFEATGRSTTRGRALDLPYLAWELDRDWPNRRFDVGPPPPRGKALVVDEGLTDEPWPADATFV